MAFIWLVLRLHRSLLAAHCLGDADTLADLSTQESVNSNRGVLSSIAREDMRSRFSGLFEKIDYVHYEDIADPVIKVSSSGDIGWAAVNVRARSAVKDGGQAFDDQWSWIMLAEKVDGQWLHAGNASNLMPKPD
jgi:ketosteroid isomerase-like protein